MAKFSTIGVEDFMRSLEAFGERAAEAIPDMLQAGADVAQQAMEATAAWQDDTGQLRRSIKRTRIKGSGTGRYIEIYPSGTTPDGQRLEEVGFVLEYGRGVSSFTRNTRNGVTKTYVLQPMAPRPWLRPAIEDNAGEIIDAMRAQWEEQMSHG